MVDWEFLIMLLLERRPVRVCIVRSLLIKLDYSQPLYLTNITLDWLREKNSIVIYFLTTSTLMTYMYVVLLKQILQIDT